MARGAQSMVAERMDRLRALAKNLWWSWNAEATAMWAEVDPLRWEKYGHNPVVLVQDVEPERWEELLNGPFGARVDSVWLRFRAYLEADSWCAGAAPELLAHGVAYFSMEFGLHESMRLYSG